MTPETKTALSREEKRAFRSLSRATAAGMLLYQLFCGNFLSLFVHTLGMSPFLIGTLFLAIQAPTLLQIWGAHYVERRGAKRLLVLCFALSPLAVLPVVFSPQLRDWIGTPAAIAAVFAGAMAYSVTSSLAGAPWMTLLRANLPMDRAAQLLGRMNRIGQVIGIAATVSFSFFLGNTPQLWRFQALFATGVLLALVRVFLFRPVKDYMPPRADDEPFRNVIGEALRLTSFRRLLIFTFVTFFAGGMVQPFRPLYITTLGFSARFAAILTVPLIFAAYAISAEAWGRIADRYGSRGAFVISCAGVMVGQLTMVAALGNTARDAAFLITGLALVPFFWAGIDAANMRRLYTIIPEKNQSIYLVLYAITVSSAISLGSFFGGIVADATESLNLTGPYTLALQYRILFLIAGIGFIAAIGYSRRMMKLNEISATQLLLILRLRTQRDLTNGLPGAFLRKFLPD